MNKIFKRHYTFIYTFILLIMVYSSSKASFFSHGISRINDSSGWQSLMENNPYEALARFRLQSNSSQPTVAADAYRGCAYVYKFLGMDDSCTQNIFKAYLIDHDTLYSDAAWIHFLTFSRTWSGHSMPEGYAVSRQLSKRKGLLAGMYKALLAERYINDGNIVEAQKIMNTMGVVRDFMMIGPFDNISGSGWRMTFGPERTLRFDTTYQGKDGAEAQWFPFVNKNPDGWIFTEYNFNYTNALFYYYSTIHSDTNQHAMLSFGASGMFKVFLNGCLVLADSVFRNTGIDMFMQQITLHKGENQLFIKIGHESQSSNFLVRFIDKDGFALKNIHYSNQPPTKTVIDTTHIRSLIQAPTAESVEKQLINRIYASELHVLPALMLSDFYNGNEFFDKGQNLCREMLKLYPHSSLWHSLLSESLKRSGKYTIAAGEQNTAYKLSNLNYSAWLQTLSVLSTSAQSREIMNFINSSPIYVRTSSEALLKAYDHALSSGNESEATRIIQFLRKNRWYETKVIDQLVDYYSHHGNVIAAEKLLLNYILYNRTATEKYSQLATLYLKQGQRQKALATYDQCLTFAPNAPGFYYFLAKHAVQYNEWKKAETHIQKAIAIAPSSSPLLQLYAEILQHNKDTIAAVEYLRRSIRVTYNDFDAWEQLFPLLCIPSPQTLVHLPNPDSLTKESLSWNPIDVENGVILASIKDVFFYSSRCSKQRLFLMVSLPSQAAIDQWKEYTISYNSFYQRLSITRAFSKNSNGFETPAETNENSIIFKTLSVGDFIVLEWTIENYYQQDMAKEVWGDHDFDLPFPVYFTLLRLIAPEHDSIPYSLQSTDIKYSKSNQNNFTITAFTRNAYQNHSKESFSQTNPPQTHRVYYSTFKQWRQIARWYEHLTQNKIENSSEIRELSDSLLRSCTTDLEKVKKIHEFITSAIRYSYIPFRQSAWIPQAAQEVISSRIGDCKDMSSLGKSFFDYAGIPSCLVLVNTRDVFRNSPLDIGPNFNHCILSYTIGKERKFCDFTDNSLCYLNIPSMDQGSLGLLIQQNSDSLIHLPIDSSYNRSITRNIHAILDTNGTLKRFTKTIKTGIFAAQTRAQYRYLSSQQKIKEIRSSITKSYPQSSIDTLWFNTGLDSLSDTLIYGYGFKAKHAVQFSGNSIFCGLNLPDIITTSSIPMEENRKDPIDMLQSWFGIGTFTIHGELQVPKSWKLLNPELKVQKKGIWGEYSLTVTRKASSIIFHRHARFHFINPIPSSESKELQQTLVEIAQADNVFLLFSRP